MAKKNTQGFYTFADGYFAWFAGLSGSEKTMQTRQHGRIISFRPTFL